ncbi:MGMT family protein [Egicoccus sp. AB-alg6-2]|uniref:MGMT family protein n=1 Tax=Egicoccus sp. AB-alg6-2 TaxID=3242692 RepID=UPI00359E30B2
MTPPDRHAADAPPLPPGGHPDPPDRLTPFQQAVVALVRDLAPGEVVTYADVAAEIGRPGSAQAVANVLRRVPGLPWWRVIPSTGRVYRTHADVQIPLLRAEGVEVDDGRHVAPTLR